MKKALTLLSAQYQRLAVLKLENLFIAVSLLFALFTLGRIIFTFHLFDFNIYYLASQDALAGKPLYQNPLIDNNYPPSALLFMIPLAALEQGSAEKLWTLLSVGLLASSIAILLRSINRYSFKNTLLVFSVAIWTFPIKFSFGLGQINFLILFFYALSFFSSVKRHDIAAGIWLGLAAAIKLTPLLLVVFFWRKQRWGSVLAAIFSFLCLQLIALGAFSPTNTLTYFTTIFPHIPTIGNRVYYNQALTGLLARAGIEAQLAWFINYGSLLIALIIVWKLMKSPAGLGTHQLMEFGSLILISLLGAGLAWQHHFVWVILPMIGIWYGSKDQLPSHRWLILSSLVLIGGNFKQPDNLANWPILLSHVGIGTGILLYVLLRELRSSLKNSPHYEKPQAPKMDTSL